MILKLSNKENTYTFTVDDLNNGEKLYYKFQIPASDVVDGKYNMVLMDDDGNIITEEQVCMGYFNAETIQYNRGENVYINSPLNANLEDVRTFTIDVPSYTIYPSEGYDAMKEVVVDAQPVYDNGYNEGENIGYTAGDIDGYNRGYNEGETTQKAKLTGITITENGTYSREDGYNEITVDVPDLNGDYNEGYDAGKVDGYDSGYTAGIEYASENAGEIAAANAVDLVATEFGTYYTKYSDNIDIVYPDLVTGIYPNGENFYDYVNLENRVYNTGIIPTKDTKIEFWYRDLFNVSSKFGIIIGSGKEDNDNCYEMKKEKSASNSYFYRWGNRNQFYNIYNQGEWNNYIISYQDGLVINGVKITDVDYPTYNGNSPFYINGAEYSTTYNNNGYFGMIKITTEGITNVIIPTKDGFKNITTGEMLEMVNDGMYAFVNNTPNTNILNNLIKSVDVQPKIGVAKYGIKFGYSTFAEVPGFYNFEGVTDMSYMFHYCNSLQTIPELDTSNVYNMSNMFAHCSSLQTIPKLNTSNVTNMESMFTNCGSLQTIPELDTSNVINMKQMFYQSPNFISIPPFNASKITFGNYSGLFYFTTMNKLTDFGGLIGFKGNANNDYTFVRCPNLTYQSCINILNGLYDFTGNGETPTSDEGNLKVHPNFLTAVGDEISIGTLKGWQISA